MENFGVVYVYPQQVQNNIITAGEGWSLVDQERNLPSGVLPKKTKHKGNFNILLIMFTMSNKTDVAMSSECLHMAYSSFVLMHHSQCVSTNCTHRSFSCVDRDQVEEFT